jgi:predicted transcriptional regulator YheO
VATGVAHQAKTLETLRDRTARELREVIETYAAERAASPRALSRESKKELVRQLHREGYFESRNSTETIAEVIGVSRSTVYNYANQA